MSADQFAKRVLDDFELHAESLRPTILNGRCRDYAEYCKISAELRGIEKAAHIVRAALAPLVEPGHPIRTQHLNDQNIARRGARQVDPRER